jgi:hypothetical protein
MRYASPEDLAVLLEQSDRVSDQIKAAKNDYMKSSCNASSNAFWLKVLGHPLLRVPASLSSLRFMPLNY